MHYVISFSSLSLTYLASVDHQENFNPMSETGQNVYLDLMEFYDILNLEFRNLYLAYI